VTIRSASFYGTRTQHRPEYRDALARPLSPQEKAELEAEWADYERRNANANAAYNSQPGVRGGEHVCRHVGCRKALASYKSRWTHEQTCPYRPEASA
jgi:hypothetical protein